MIEEQLYEQIEAYLEGKMSRDELESFEQRMQQDAILASKVKIHKELSLAIPEVEEIDQLKGKLKHIINQSKEQENVPPKNNKYSSSILIALVLLLATAIGLYYYFNQEVTEPQQLYQAYVDFPSQVYEPDEVRSTDATNSESEQTLDSLWRLANRHYEGKQIDELVAVLQQITIVEQTLYQSNTSQFYYVQGLASLKQNQPLQAIQSFDQVQINFTEDALWKKAMALLLLDEGQEEAKLILNNIRASASHPKRNEARKVLNQMN